MDKFNALVHFIIHVCSSRPEKLGATRLNKVLWFADVYSYQIYGQPITGGTYVKRQYGPTPYSMLPALNQLETEGLIQIQEPQGWSLSPRLFLSLQEPDETLLTQADRRLAFLALQEILPLTAREASERTHDTIWDAAAMGEEIPLFATLATPGEISPEVIEWADSRC